MNNKHLHENRTVHRIFLWGVLTMMLVFGLFPGGASATGEDFDNYIGQYIAKDKPGQEIDHLEIVPTVPHINNHPPGQSHEDAQLLGTKDDNQFVDIRATYNWQANEETNTTFKFQYTVYRCTGGPYVYTEHVAFAVVILEVGIDDLEGEGELCPVPDVVFNNEEREEYIFVFRAFMWNGEQQYEYAYADGCGYTDPEESPSA